MYSMAATIRAKKMRSESQRSRSHVASEVHISMELHIDRTALQMFLVNGKFKQKKCPQLRIEVRLTALGLGFEVEDWEMGIGSLGLGLGIGVSRLTLTFNPRRAMVMTHTCKRCMDC